MTDKWWLKYFTPCCNEMSEVLKHWHSELSFMLGEMQLSIGKDELGWPKEWVLRYCPFCSSKIKVTGMITDLNGAIKELREITERQVEVKKVKLFPLDLNSLSLQAKLDYLHWLSDPEVTKYLECRFQQHTPESTESYIKNCRASGYIFGILCAREGEDNPSHYIGNIRLTVNSTHQFAEVGILIGSKEDWGKGYGTEAISLVRDYAFKTLSLHKLAAGCYACNPASIRAFEKAGFVREGLLRSQYRTEWGRYTDEVVLGCLANEPFTTFLDPLGSYVATMNIINIPPAFSASVATSKENG